MAVVSPFSAHDFFLPLPVIRTKIKDDTHAGLLMNIISSKKFKHTIKDIHKHTENRKLCFVLGAGTSVKSGIPSGGELAEKWFAEIKERLTKKELDDWLKSEKVDVDDLATHYGSIYRKRFESDKNSGYEFLVQIMRDAKPSFGHVILAQILTKTAGHCVLTTNFDSLVETAIYQFTDQTPLVCGHESLSGYARPSSIHPLIVKIHRDLLLAPKSDPDEISKLDVGWKEPLDNIFSNHIPVVIGYGGNDGSLMRYFENMNKPSNFFWCGRKKSSIPHRIEQLIQNMDGSYVEIDGFDELMHELLWVFDEIKPVDEELDEVTKARIEAVKQQGKTITQKLETKDVEVIDSLTQEEADPDPELSAYEYSELAKNESDYEKRKAIYLAALEKFPNTAWLWHEFTYFLDVIKKDYDDLEEYYLKALTLEPEDADLNGNYALFLENIKKDHDKAEEYYLKALSLDSESANKNGNYALFLENIKKDYDKAEACYLKALSLDPEHANNNGNYAIFLKDIKKDYDKAEAYYLKALALENDNALWNGGYAIFLHTVKKDYEKAEEYYLKALSLEPEDADFNGNYAQLLFITGRKEEAKSYLDKAFKFNNNEAKELSLEIWFYQYAHDFDSLEESEKAIVDLLDEGHQSVGWDFSENIRVAIEDGHPNPERLQVLADLIASLK